MEAYYRLMLTTIRIGLFQSYYEKHILDQYSPSAISWIFTIQLFLLFVLLRRKYD